MQRRSFRRIFISSAAMLFLVTTHSLTSDVQARRRTKGKVPAVQELTVALTEKGYEPNNLKLRRGIPAQITFIRKVSPTGLTQIVVPDYDIKRDLPMNVPVLVEFTPQNSGTLSFSCGMGMLSGSLIVR
jgi:plastocyanin domain-containing protein